MTAFNARVKQLLESIVPPPFYRVTLDTLPNTPPYGFWVDRHGNIVVVRRMYGHDDALIEFYPGKIFSTALSAGMVRMVKSGNIYVLTTDPVNRSDLAMRTAKKICKYYNFEWMDDLEGF